MACTICSTSAWTVEGTLLAAAQPCRRALPLARDLPPKFSGRYSSWRIHLRNCGWEERRMEFAALFRSTRGAFLDHERAKSERGTNTGNVVEPLARLIGSVPGHDLAVQVENLHL